MLKWFSNTEISFLAKNIFSSYSAFLLEMLDFLNYKNNQTTNTKIFQSDKRLELFLGVSWLMFFTILHLLLSYMEKNVFRQTSVLGIKIMLKYLLELGGSFSAIAINIIHKMQSQRSRVHMQVSLSAAWALVYPGTQLWHFNDLCSSQYRGRHDHLHK